EIRCALPVRPAGRDLLAGEVDTEALDQFGHGVRAHLKSVTGAQLGQSLCIRRRDTAEVDQFVEEALEACGRDNLEDSAGLHAGVPERVPLLSWLKDQVARTSF